jgi:hypothetical protein
MMAEAEHCWSRRTKGAASYERVVDAKYLEEIRAAAKIIFPSSFSRESRVAKRLIELFRAEFRAASSF